MRGDRGVGLSQSQRPRRSKRASFLLLALLLRVQLLLVELELGALKNDTVGAAVLARAGRDAREHAAHLELLLDGLLHLVGLVAERPLALERRRRLVHVELRGRGALGLLVLGRGRRGLLVLHADA